MLPGRMTTTLFLVRHGQTDSNKVRQVQGHTDTPLNALGRDQATALGKYLDGRGVRFSAAVTSPLSRADETARLVLAPQPSAPELLRDARLMERNFGVFEGKSFAELAEDRGVDRGALYDETPDGGESLETVQRRALGAFEAFAAEKSGNILMVAHGGVIGALVCHLLALAYRSASLRRFRRDNTGFTRIALGPPRAILTLNDIGHLD